MISKFRSLLNSAALLLGATPASAAFITWDVNEVFSNADGTIQFIEFVEANGQSGQRSFDGKQLKTFEAGAAPNETLNVYTFSVDVGSDLTANKFALIATQGFASLPGAVQPDFVMPDGFIDLALVAEIELGNIDEFQFSVGAIPTDGVNSLYRSGPSVGVNTPTNFAGQTGSIDLPQPLASWDVNEVFSNADGTIQFVELVESDGEDRQQSFAGEQLATFAAGSPSTALSTYGFTTDLPSDVTANKFALLATQGFAALPGAVPPDYVIPDGFIDPSVVAEIAFANIDDFLFSAGAIPTDGIDSLHRSGPSVGVNSPTNFAGQAGSIDVPEAPSAAMLGAAFACIAALRRHAVRRPGR